MALFDTGENNVGQFGADNSNIIRYKQAAEYAEDARLYALAAAESMTDADNVLNRAEEILAEAREILSEIQDIESEVEGLEARVAVAEAIANEAIAKAQQAIDDTAGIIAAAQGYANAAQASSNEAQGFSQSAAQSAANASSAVTQAQGYRDEASDFADEAEVHVTEAENAVDQAETQADRAKTEADRAAEIVAGIPGKETIDGFAKVYRNKNDADADVTERTLGDKVLVWDNETSVYTWYDVTGTLDAKALTLNTTEKKLKTVNNIQPDDEGNVQVTLPSGNPSLWLGETVLFQYDPEKNVSYPGLLPQDGREVNRADYPDLWSSIAQNFIPSVSEADWQAGKTNCFSTGNGTTTFRVPKWSGEVLRTPNAGDEKGEVVSQIPYVVTVNGVAPNDTTGNVQLDVVSNSAMTLAINNATATKANRGANTDITSLSGLTTPLSVAQGGTGSNTVLGARNSLSAAKSGINADITGLSALTGAITFTGTPATLNVGGSTSTYTFSSSASGSSSVGGDITNTSGELGLYGSGGSSVRLRADGTSRIENSSGTSAIDLNAAGVNVTGNINANSSAVFIGGAHINRDKSAATSEIALYNNSGDTTNGVRFGIQNVTGNLRRFYSADYSGNGQVVQTLPNTNGTITVATSDKNLKDYTGNVIPEEALSRIKQIVPVEFNWNEKFTYEENILDKPRRGFFAQDVFAIDERYAVKPSDQDLSNGIVWGLEDRAIMADMVSVIQTLLARIETLEQIAAQE